MPTGAAQHRERESGVHDLLPTHDKHQLRRPSLGRLLPFVLAACLSNGAACGDSRPERPTTLTRYPHAMDRLARLMREEFTSAEPVAVEQAIRCEAARVQRAIGDDFPIRQRFLLDSLHEEFTAEQFNQLGQRLAS